MLKIMAIGDDEWKVVLENIYTNPNESASFSGAAKLQESLKSHGYIVSKYKINKYLEGKPSYALFREKRKSFQRNNITVAGIDDLFQADLFSISKLDSENDGVKYILAVIDVFSRYAWVRPLSNKTPGAVSKAFESILEDGRIPKSLNTDMGGEFRGVFKKLMEKYHINHYFSLNETKCAYVERLIRSLKNRIFRYLEEKNTSNYIEEIQNIVRNYNHTRHRSIGIQPSLVTKENENLIFWGQYWPKTKKNLKKRSLKIGKRYKFKIGAYVRIGAINDTFSKVGHANFTSEIFKVKHRFRREGIPVYKLTDFYGDEVIKGLFYGQELIAASIKDDEEYKIEKIIKYRGRKRDREALIKWRFWPSKFNSWVRLKDITKL